jgi:hypothetical protein
MVLHRGFSRVVQFDVSPGKNLGDIISTNKPGMGRHQCKRKYVGDVGRDISESGRLRIEARPYMKNNL